MLVWDKTGCPFLSGRNDLYFINITAAQNSCCINCNNPVKKPEEKFNTEDLKNIANITLNIKDGEEISPDQAA